ncbi:MAG: toprim domain-containing protein, partial [Candidatus Electrothrix sp. AR4]|nr:toprim domain-containing protein [Candidatus Electrothrix sp. AR4]
LGYTPAPENAGWRFITSRLQAKKIPVGVVEEAGLAVRKDRGGHYDRFRDRILFPIYDMSGREVAFGGRLLGDGKPKYMNSPESLIFTKSGLLFGLYQHRQAIRKSRRAIVVEGNFDLLLLAVHGIDNVVAPLGTALTREHIKSLHGYCDEVILLFDGDSAGLKAVRRSIPFFLSERMEGRVALMPEGHDPDSLVLEKGAEGVQELLNTASPLAEFVFSALVKEYGLTLSGKNRIICDLVELIREASDPSQRELMAAHFSEQLGVSPSRFLTAQNEFIQSPQRQGKADMGPEEMLHEVDLDMVPPDIMLPEEMFGGPPERSGAIDSFADLPKKQRQLLEFMVLYPEFVPELLIGGLRESVVVPSVLSIIDSMELLAAAGPFMPEQLLSVLTSPEERQYVAELLTRGTGDEIGIEEQGRELCDELLAWLKEVKRKKVGMHLQKQINQAELDGDSELVSELMNKMLENNRIEMSLD